jgi:hypothetical protein
MKSISLLAFAVGSAAASTTPTQKLRSHAVAEGLRFAKVAETSCDPSVSLETSWLPPSGKPGQERNKYVVKCNAPRVNPNTDELLVSLSLFSFSVDLFSLLFLLLSQR